MLSIARRLAPLDVPLIGINQGRLGFLTDIPLAEHGSDARRRCSTAATSRSGARCSPPTVERADGAREHALALNDVVVNRGALRQHDRVRGRDRRPLRLRDARRRHHRRHADRLDRVRAVGRRPDPRAAGAGVRAGAGRAARAHASADRHRRHVRRSRSRSTAGRDAARALRRPGAFRARRRRSRRAARARRTRARFLHPEGHDYFAMLREKLHWSETPERIRGQSAYAEGSCCACCRSAISSSSRRSTSSSTPGFTVLTGETGAGKSILLDALGLLLGDRFELRQLRPGAERAELAAEFDVADAPGVGAWLAEQELAADGDDVLLRRVLDAQGKSRAWINGRPATLAQLEGARRAAGRSHGQHAHQSLAARRRAARRCVDAFGGFTTLTREVGEAWRAWRAAVERARCRGERRAGVGGRARVPRGAPRELAALGVTETEWARAVAAQSRLAHAAALIEAATQRRRRARRRRRRADARLAQLAQRLRAARGARSGAGRDRRAARARGDPARRSGARAARLSPAARPRSRGARARRGAARRDPRHRAQASRAPGRAAGAARRNRSAPRRARRSRGRRGARAARGRGRAQLSRARRAAVVEAALRRQRARASRDRGDAGARDGRRTPRDRADARVRRRRATGSSASSSASRRTRSSRSGPLARVASGGELSRIALAIQVVAERGRPGADARVRRGRRRHRRRRRGDRRARCCRRSARAARCCASRICRRSRRMRTSTFASPRSASGSGVVDHARQG